MRAGVGAKRVKKAILDHDREPQRDQQDIAVVAGDAGQMTKRCSA